MVRKDAERAKISYSIDEELKREAANRNEARRKEVKVMLLGQADSGKSTLRKQFQLFYASPTLEEERPAWRPVVYFNIIKAIRMILDELDWELISRISDKDYGFTSGSILEEVSGLRSKLLPLVAVEESLASELSGGASISGGRIGAVRSGWQALLPNQSTSEIRAGQRFAEATLMAGRIIAGTASAIQALWAHRVVRNLIETRKLRLDESAPFFLNKIERIAMPDYLPNTDDILNARLQTVGVVEHRFPVEMGNQVINWKLYDVGGARGQRPTWVPYFDDATAIIFLAPMSAYDQYVEEDPKKNRISDSLELWRLICSNKLLKNADLVLLLNKADLLDKKLKSGIRVNRYITSYGDRPNDYQNVSEYFKLHFMQIHKKLDLSSRELYVHFTSMLDIRATQVIIGVVGDKIIRKHITETGLM